jgi:hypothetical protein
MISYLAFEIARSASNDPTRLIEAKISVKELISFLHCHYVEPTDIVCSKSLIDT